MSIGWPQGIYIAITLLALMQAFAKDGEPRGPYSASSAAIGAVLGMLLLWWGGFFG